MKSFKFNYNHEDTNLNYLNKFYCYVGTNFNFTVIPFGKKLK